MIKHQVDIIFSPVQMNFGSSSLPISQPQIPSTRTSFDAVDFAYRLNKLSTFLPAAHELILVLYKSKHIITTRKTIRLLELARKTLQRAGIVLYSFASCPETFVAYKKAYIDLLKIVQANIGQANTELQGRIQILLMPLTSNFSIRKRDNSIDTCSTSPQRHSRTIGVSFFSGEGTDHKSSESPATAVAQPATNAMLPPDAFPEVIRPQSSIRDSPLDRPRSPLWDYRQFENSPISSSKRCRLDQENIITQSGKYRPPKRLRQFGIYCTRKSSMDNLNSFRRSERQTLVL